MCNETIIKDVGKPYSYKEITRLFRIMPKFEIYFEGDELVVSCESINERSVQRIVGALNGAYLLGSQHTNRYHNESKETIN